MKKTMLLISFVMSNFMCAGDWHDRWNASGKDPFEKWTNTLNSIETFSPDERIIMLTSALGVGELGKLEGKQLQIFDRAQSMLLAIPGHAKYYQEKIEEMRADALENSKKTAQELARMQDNGQEVIWESTYEIYRGKAIRSLQFMPSSETVTVLGHFLDDPEGKDGKNLVGHDIITPGMDTDPRPRNAERAAMSIRKLGIEHPPFKIVERKWEALSPGELDAWKDWWSEVKDGRRTYRFIGSKIEYGPDGPASKEAVQRAEGNQKRDEERATRNKRTSPVSDSEPADSRPSKSLPVAGLIAACLLSAFALWHFVKRSQPSR